MGRPYAAVALAVVLTRQAGTAAPAGISPGCCGSTKKASCGWPALLWALREAKWGKRSKSLH